MNKRMGTYALRGSKASGLAINAALFIITTIICISLLEIYLRYQHAKEHTSLLVKYVDRDLCTTKSGNLDLIYTYIPGKCGANSRGYIDSEYTYPKGENSYRVVIIGDSVAEGQGVPMGKSFGKVLEERLNHNNRDNKAEVIVLARTGYSTSQQLVLLHDEAFRYEPDLIIWSYVLNDPAHPFFHNANGELGRFFYEPEFQFVYQFNKLLFILREKIGAANCDSEYHKQLHCIYASEVEKNINRIGDASRANNVPVLFAIHPVFEEYGSFSTYTLGSLHEELAMWSTAAGLETIDFLDAYTNYRPEELHQEGYRDGWWDPWHPNLLGHRLIADYLYSHITDANLQ